MTSTTDPVSIAIIGCGAIAELGHLPGALVSDRVTITALIDRDEPRARAMAERFGVPFVGTDMAQAADHAEAAVVALPPHLHRHGAEVLLGAGLHVLMEKPLATNLADSDAMVSAARAANRLLGVAMMRRFASSAEYLKAAVASGMLGPIRHYTARSGAADAWPSRSPFTFDAEQAGGGALISNGCHDVDLLFWLLGPLADFTFHSDSPARMESNCVIEGTLARGGTATIEISRSRTLANTIRIEGAYATIEAPLMGETVQVFPSGTQAGDFPQAEAPPLDYARVMARQLDNFAGAIRGTEPLLADGATGRDMIAFVNQCYERNQMLELPWDCPIALGEAA
ncbi:MAG: Gfo/Idh/MocA family protein [Novosphingobium sp.]